MNVCGFEWWDRADEEVGFRWGDGRDIEPWTCELSPGHDEQHRCWYSIWDGVDRRPPT